ncbi:anti-repressor SinI family protein [Sinobaca qinghaiensis]|nr:anti-repressor SinI family protein [Sinobaca qinghaiensis]
MTKQNEKKLDHEWMALILEAKKTGLTVEQVRDFLHYADDTKKKP